MRDASPRLPKWRPRERAAMSAHLTVFTAPLASRPCARRVPEGGGALGCSPSTGRRPLYHAYHVLLASVCAGESRTLRHCRAARYATSGGIRAGNVTGACFRSASSSSIRLLSAARSHGYRSRYAETAVFDKSAPDRLATMPAGTGNTRSRRQKGARRSGARNLGAGQRAARLEYRQEAGARRINRAGLVLWVPASAESDRSLRA
jgi:hypothetical protein